MDSNSPIILKNVAEAVDDLISLLPLKIKAEIARMEESELIELRLSSLGRIIRSELGLCSGNNALTKSYQETPSETDLHGNETSAVVINNLWEKLRKTHLLRIVE
jgi:hypothetical protein